MTKSHRESSSIPHFAKENSAANDVNLYDCDSVPRHKSARSCSDQRSSKFAVGLFAFRSIPASVHHASVISQLPEASACPWCLHAYGDAGRLQPLRHRSASVDRFVRPELINTGRA